MKKSLLILFSVAFTLFNFSISIAQPGSLDETFDGDGKLTLNFGVIENIGYAVAIQEDGKIVVAGYSYNPSGPNSFDFALVRLNPDGTLDNSFDMDGKVTTDFNSSIDAAVALKIQPNGKILAAGYSQNTISPTFAMARYNTDGSLDGSFGAGGLVTTVFTGYDVAYAMALQDDGKILLAGMTQEDGNCEDFAIARYYTDGSLDNSFGTGGKITTDFLGYHDAAYGIAVQADGKIIAVGYSNNGSWLSDFGLVRYNTDGSFDASFGFDGKMMTDFNGNIDKARSIVIQPDGKIVVGGTAYTANGYDFGLARYNTDGFLDTSFDEDGKVTSSFLNQYPDWGYSVVLQEDGKIILAGSFGSTGDVDKFGMIRYNTDGSYDFSFGMWGFTVADFGDPNERSYSVAIQPDKKIILAGYSADGGESAFAIARFISGLETGVLNFSDNQSQLLVYPNPIYSSATLKYSLQKGEIISIDLYDMKGSIVQSFISNQHKQEGNNEEVLNFSNSIPAGYYNLVISNEEGQQSIRIVKL
ncbi:MAG: T9SS type A sorting domain-containing protein [Bacteroidales bacterium]|nr:T9SS type A sorting domain-containing protein [Bacteroidales bacterium]